MSTDTQTVASVSNTTLLKGAHAAMQALPASATSVTLVGVRTNPDGTVDIVRSEDGKTGIPVEHTMDELVAFGAAITQRGIDERKSMTLKDENGNRGKHAPSMPADGWGAIKANLTIVLVEGKNPFWVGMIGSDLWAAKGLARAARTAAAIDKTGGFAVDGEALRTAYPDLIDEAIENLTTMNNGDPRVFPSMKKAVNNLARTLHTGDGEWFTDAAVKAALKTEATPFAYGLRAPVEDAVETSEDTQVEATVPTLSAVDLRAQCKQLGISAGGSKVVMQERIRAALSDLGFSIN